MALTSLVLLCSVVSASAQPPRGLDPNEPGILEPVTSFLQQKEIRVPNTDQSLDGDEQTSANNTWVIEDALVTTSMLGHPITHVASPNDDLRLALQGLAGASGAGDAGGMQSYANELLDILLGKTEGRIYDGFSMLNFNRWQDTDVTGITAAHFPPDVMVGEYKMKAVRDSGETIPNPFVEGDTAKVYEVDINMLYYDGQIDSDTFLVRFPADADKDDVLRVNYRIYSLVREDFSPTLVMLDRRQQGNTVAFPFKGFDAVWIAFEPGEVLNVSVNYPPLRMVRGVYDWGWRVHPPRIQFMQPVYEIVNAHTGEVELEAQSQSFAFRNREDLTLDTIADAAPEMKMYRVATGVLNGASASQIHDWLTDADQGPFGTWVEWASLVKEQRQLPREAWDVLVSEGLTPGEFGEYQMITVFMNNEMYGEGPFLNEIRGWDQGNTFRVKLINFDKHTHYFRNVDFGTRLHDDILRCCGGGETSFEVMNFKPSFGAPKVAEMQWRAGWGFRPHFDVIQQGGVFPRGSDRMKLRPFTGGGIFGKEGGTFFGFQYSEANRRGDFRFNPPPFIIGVNPLDPNSSADVLRDADGNPGLVLGQFTKGYGVAQMCPQDPFPGFCRTDISQFNPTGALNFPPPPLRGQPVFPEDVGKFPGDVYPDQAVELRFPPFLRNPSQGLSPSVTAGDDWSGLPGDIIPPTGAWETFTWINPNNGTLFIDPDQPELGHWADLTYAHGAPLLAGATHTAVVELPRASAQVFYQFDDLFHDNDIFSPHPLFEGEDMIDSVADVRASTRGSSLRVSGTLGELAPGEFGEWVTVHVGGAEAEGCTGDALGFAPVGSNGRFVFRGDAAGVGSTVCVASVIGGFAEVPVQ